MDGDMWINLFDRQMSNFVHVHVHLHIWTYTCTCPYMDIYIHVCHVIFLKGHGPRKLGDIQGLSVLGTSPW